MGTGENEGSSATLNPGARTTLGDIQAGRRDQNASALTTSLLARVPIDQ